MLYPLSYGGGRATGDCSVAASDRREEGDVTRVLVVDDDASIRQLLELTFSVEGFEVTTARDGREGLHSALDDPPDVVVLDVMMPELDGWTVAERLKADPRTADVPVVFLSARTQDSDLRRGRELGAAAYVTKPFDTFDLVELVSELVGTPGA